MGTNDKSILTTVKKALGLSDDYTPFDEDLILFINGQMGELRQLGIGPPEGFEIEDKDQKWSDLLGEELRLSGAKTLVVQRCRQQFDPPENGAVIISMEKQILELQWRLSVVVDEIIAEIVAESAGAYVWILDEQGNFPNEAAYGDVGFNPVNRMIWRKVPLDA